MMSSGEVAQMFAAQNQQFMGQNQFAQSLGVTAPNSSLAGWGTPQAMGGQANFPGMRPQHQPFNYSPGAWGGGGYQGGTRVAGGAMSALGGAASLAGTGLGVASMFGKMGALAPLVDPFAAGAMGYGMAGVGGAIAGAAVPLALAYGASKAVSTFVGGGQQQQAVQSNLGSYGFMNSASRTGTGFTRDDSAAIGQSIRSIAHVPEMLTSMEELTKLMPKMKSMGVMQGVRDATEFSSRFKETIKTVRDISKLLGTTMEEAADFFSASRQNGFLGRQAQVQNTLNAQFTAGSTGMSTGQVMQMQAGGAGLAQSLGARRSLGATAVTNIAQSLGMAQQSGSLQEGILEDMTGQQGPEAVQAASQRMAEVMSHVAQGPVGRLAMAGMVKFDESGKAVGLDEEKVKKFQRGELGVSELKRMASGMTNKQKISFTARAADLSMSLAGQVGPGGIGQFLKQIGEDKYGEEGVNLLLQRQGGMSSVEADAFMQMSDQAGQGGPDKKAFAQRQAREAEIRNRTDPKAIMGRLGTRMFKGMGGAFLEDSGAKVYGAIGKAYDEFVDDLVGRHVITMSKEGADKLHAAFTGANKGDLKKMFSEAFGDKAGKPSGPGGGATTVGGLLARGAMMASPLGLAASSLTGSTDAIGEGLNKMLGTGDLRDTGIASWLQGSRTSRAQFEHLKGELGTSDMSDADADKMNQYRTGALQQLGKSDSFIAARSEIGKLAAGIEGFSDMTGQKKLDALSSAIGNADEGTQAVLRGAAGAAGKILGGEGNTNTALALASGFVNPDEVGGGSEVFSYENTAELSKKIRGAENEVEEKLGPEGAALLKAKPEARRLLLALHDPKNPKSGVLNNALMSSDPQKAVDELKKLGYNLSLADVQSVQSAHNKITTSGKAEDITSSIQKLSKLQMQGDISVAKEQASAVKGSVSDTGLQKALGAFIDAKTGDTFADSQTKVGNAVEDIVKRATAATDPKKREEILASAGEMREAAEAGMNVTAKGIQGKTGAELAKKYRLSAADLASAGITATDKVGAGQLSKVQALVERARSSDVLLASKSTAAGDKDSEMVAVLKKIDKSLDLNTSMIAVQAGILKGDDAKKVGARVTATLKEGSGSASNGKSSGGDK